MIAKRTAHGQVKKIDNYQYFTYFRHSILHALISYSIFNKL
jgi:hypothetical protein